MPKPSAAIVLSCMLALTWIGFVAERPRAAEQAKPAAQKWEYKIVGITVEAAEAHDKLNKLGDDGWELSAVSNDSVFIFTRPKQ